MARSRNQERKPTDLIADVLNEAGMESRHKTFQKKYRQLLRLELTEHECEMLLELPEETLEYLFKSGGLSKHDRRALFDSMRRDWNAAILALTERDFGPDELRELKNELRSYGAVGARLVDEGSLE
jgi:hypothetical protein